MNNVKTQWSQEQHCLNQTFEELKYKLEMSVDEIKGARLNQTFEELKCELS